MAISFAEFQRGVIDPVPEETFGPKPIVEIDPAFLTYMYIVLIILTWELLKKFSR